MAYWPASRPTFTTGSRGGVGQHDGHLQQHPQLVAHVVGGHPGERLGAVATLEQERLARARPRPILAIELVALAREDQRRHRAQAVDGSVDRTPVGVRRLLGRAEGVQGRAGRGWCSPLQGTAGRRPAPDSAPRR